MVAVSRAPRGAPEFWLQADLNDARVEWPAVDTAICLGPLDAFAAWLQRQPATGLRRVIALSSMSAESKRESPDPAERALAVLLTSDPADVVGMEVGDEHRVDVVGVEVQACEIVE